MQILGRDMSQIEAKMGTPPPPPPIFRMATQDRMVITQRGPGQLVGEVSLFEKTSAESIWQTNVRAATAVRALTLTREDLQVKFSHA